MKGSELRALALQSGMVLWPPNMIEASDEAWDRLAAALDHARIVEKGPRPYHVRTTREACDEWMAIWSDMKVDPRISPQFIGMDFGSDDTSYAVTMDANGIVDVQEISRDAPHVHPAQRRAHDSDCAMHNEPAMPAGNCTCGAFEREKSETGNDHTNFPKVGLEKPVDIMAITRAISGG